MNLTHNNASNDNFFNLDFKLYFSTVYNVFIKRTLFNEFYKKKNKQIDMSLRLLSRFFFQVQFGHLKAFKVL